MFHRRHLCVLVLMALGPPTTGRADEPLIAPSVPAHSATETPATPVAMLVLQDGSLLTANRDRGSVSRVDLQSGTVLSETRVAKTPVCLRPLVDGRVVLVDHDRHELLLLETENDEIVVSDRFAAPRFPIDAATSDDGNWLAVTGLWSRRLDVVSLDGPSITLDLPFCPRCVLVMEDRKRIVVTGAFGNQLAVIRYETSGSQSRPSNLRLESVRPALGHNLRGLTRINNEQGDRIAYCHMLLSPLAHPSLDEVHWGNFLSSGIAMIPMANVLDRHLSLTASTRRVPLGDVGHGAADPESFFTDSEGRFITAIGGTHEATIHDRFGNLLDRIAVGNGPVATLPLPDGGIVVLNRFSNSVAMLEKTTGEDNPTWNLVSSIDLGGPARREGTARGEQRFHDATLSHDGWMSCHSCHTQGHSNGLLADTLGDRSAGAPKRVLSLRGIRGTEPLAWNGSATMSSQIKKSVLSTMHGPELSNRDTRDLISFLDTLPPTPRYRPSSQSVGESDGVRERDLVQESAVRGKKLFHSRDCVNCHQGETKTSPKTYDVGVEDELGTRRFNPPSLRGVVYRDRLLHDGRARSLRELFDVHAHPRGEVGGDEQAWTPEDLGDLIRFLESL